MPWDSTKTYISKVNLPGDNTDYYLKDADARAAIDLLSNATHFLGVTTTELTDGGHTATITVGSKTYALNPTSGQEQLVNGDIVISTASEASVLGADEDGTEFICVIEGTPATITWYKFGSAKLNDLGNLAYKDSVETTVDVIKTVTSSAFTYVTGVSSVTQPTITVTPSTAAIKTTVASNTYVTDVSYSKVTGISYSKATGGSVVVDSSATFTGTIVNAVTGVTGGTGTKNSATSLALYTVANGQKIITDVAINASGTGLVEGVTVSSVTGGAATVGSATVYGLESETTKYMTGAETLDKKPITVLSAVSSSTTVSAINASVTVSNETLTFTSVTPLSSITFSTASVLSSTTGIVAGASATATAYTVGKSGATTFTQPTVTLSVDACGLTVTSNTYKVSVPANTWVDTVTAAAATTSDIGITVSGSAVTDGTVTITNTTTAADITNTATAATLTKNDATNWAIGASTGGYTVVTGISSATATGTAVTLSTSTASAITGVTSGKVTSA